MADKSQSAAKAGFKFFKYFIMLLVLVVCATIAFRFGSAVFSNDGVEDPPGVDLTVSVPKGTTISGMGDLLEKYNIISDANVFGVQAWLYGVKKVKPGTYSFNNSKGGEDILKIINGGPNTNKKGEKIEPEDEGTGQ
ncbi:MAG: endolytic transglycosylase MltG [Eubacterium sp.]|nr:endolytic transglycosylase MltG [Eubacterium sp.]